MSTSTYNAFHHKYSLKPLWSACKETSFLISAAVSFALLSISLWLNYYSSLYATERTSNFVTDIILDNIRVYDVDIIFIYGPLVLLSFLVIILLLHPRKIPFTLKTISLFVIVRSFFVILTHIGPSPLRAYIDPTNFMAIYTAGDDLFFSGHTGLPFLLALIYWNQPPLRIIFMITSFFFGAIVLMGHFHYSIDVVAAFFITATIYHLSERWFKKDKKEFDANQSL